MINQFSNDSLLTAAIWFIFVVINSLLIKISDHYQKRQQLIVEVDGNSFGKLEFKYILGNVLLGIFIFFWSSFVGETWFQFFFGGFVFTQAIAIALSIKNVWALKLLLDPSLVKGRLEVSPIYRY